MIEKLKIRHYRKLKDIEIGFNNKVNIISGTNGTCKSSILYLISNAFQEVKSTADWLIEPSVLKNIKSINTGMNLKIESLTRGDDKYNDPAQGDSGSLFSCTYIDGLELEFRRHNTKENEQNRFALKPYYKRGASEKLPQCPTIYLGLGRLYSFGEYHQEISKIKQKMPSQYFDIIRDIYKDFTGITIENIELQAMQDIKRRSKFTTPYEGIDSNTISAGEDNLLIIITALVSLRYYFENIKSVRDEESILLIDEVDATLHPAYQYQLLDLINEYAQDYHIKCVFTTHSLSMIEYAFEKKNNVIYLLDNVTDVCCMEDADIYKIKMYLQNKTKDDIYINRCIPIFSEDSEARKFIECLFDYFGRRYGVGFQQVRPLFHMVDASISGDALISIFKDSKLIRSTMRSICIVDGDKESGHNLNNYTITLPGKMSPEKLVFKYAEQLFNEDSGFWKDKTVVDLGYTKVYYQRNIKKDVDSISEKIREKKEKDGSAHGVERSLNKEVFNRHERFFILVMKKWIEDNPADVAKFYDNLHILFCKVAEFHDVSSREWEYKENSL